MTIPQIIQAIHAGNPQRVRLSDSDAVKYWRYMNFSPTTKFALENANLVKKGRLVKQWAKRYESEKAKV